jgi:superfamily II DNA/RNA helicase
MTFEELQLIPPILKALAQCGHDQPTMVQTMAIPKALSGRDLIASAQTGTGKTAAFVLPALQRLTASPAARKAGPRVLVLAPTRELADQIAQAARMYGKYLRVKCTAIYGGMPFREQVRALSQSPDMIVATPGRLLDHMSRRLIDLSSIEIFILDEADRMLDMGFIEDVERISDSVPEACQTLLFAATMGNATTRLAQRLMKDPDRVQVAPGKITHDTIEQRLHVADSLQHKNRLLQHICADSSVTRAIIFSATRHDADVLAQDLNRQGHTAAALHGDMTQSARNRTMLNMRRGKIRLLVATDVAARGLDVTGISHVINFDLPRFAEDYVNRIGRTGRAGESGIAISFASYGELPYLDRIERYLGQNLAMHVIPGLEPAHPLRTHNIGRTAGLLSDLGAGETRGRKGRAAHPSFSRGKNDSSDRKSGNGKHRPGKWNGEVTVEYRSGKSTQADWAENRKPVKKSASSERSRQRASELHTH